MKLAFVIPWFGLDIPGGDLPQIHYLRTLADSRAIIAKATAARRAVVIGAYLRERPREARSPDGAKRNPGTPAQHVLPEQIGKADPGLRFAPSGLQLSLSP